jgi:DNA-directed RNA polymerase subunit RPC12/RpoP
MVNGTTDTIATQYQCPHCWAKFKTKIGIESHLIKHFEKNENPLLNATLTSVQFEPSIVPESTKTLPKQPQRKYNCFQCSKSYNTRWELTRHTRSHSATKSYKCPHCASAYQCNASLTRHLKTHPCETFRCNLCKVLHKSKLELENHRCQALIQEMNDTFKCSLCEATFKCRVSLNRHLIEKHSSIKYQCAHCPEIMETKSKIKAHLVRHFPCNYNKTDSQGKLFRFQCHHCPEIMATRTTMKKHVLGHFVREYNCVN